MSRTRKPKKGPKDDTDDAPPAIVVDDTAAGLNAAAASRFEGPAGDSGALEGEVVGQVGGDFAGDAAQQVAAGQAGLEAMESHSDDGDTEGTPLGGFDDLQTIVDARHSWATGEAGGDGDSPRTGSVLDDHNMGDTSGVSIPDFNPLDGDSEGNPLSYGLGEIAEKLGHTGQWLTVGVDDQSHTTSPGQSGIADGGFQTVYNSGGRKVEHYESASGLVVRQTTTTDTKVGTRTEIITYDPKNPEVNVTTVETVNTKSGVFTSHSTDANGDTTTVVDRPKGNKTTTTTQKNDDGSVTKTTVVERPDGSVTTTTETTPSTEMTDPDGEGAPLPPELQAIVDAQDAELRALMPRRNPDDGTTDPADSDDAAVGAPTTEAGGLIARAGGAVGLLGQPAPGENPELVSTGAPAFNSGAHGIDGLIQGDFEGSHTLGPEERNTQHTIKPTAGTDGSETDDADDGDEGSSLLTVAQPDLAAVVDIVPDEITIAVVDDVDDPD